MDTKLYKCKFCHKNYTGRRYLNRHINEIHKKNEKNISPCPYCKKNFYKGTKTHKLNCFLNPIVIKSNFIKKYKIKEIYENSQKNNIIEFVPEIFNNFMNFQTKSMFDYINEKNFLNNLEEYKKIFDNYQEEQKIKFNSYFNEIKDKENNNNNNNINNLNESNDEMEIEIYDKINTNLNIFENLNKITNIFINDDNSDNHKYICLYCFKKFANNQLLFQHLFNLGNKFMFCYNFQEKIISQPNLDSQIYLIIEMLKYSNKKIRTSEILINKLKEELNKILKFNNITEPITNRKYLINFYNKYLPDLIHLKEIKFDNKEKKEKKMFNSNVEKNNKNEEIEIIEILE